jgi:predicted RNase H-like nuclease
MTPWPRLARKARKGKRRVHSGKVIRLPDSRSSNLGAAASRQRPAGQADSYAEASAINRQKTGRGLSQQPFFIGRKIKQVDDAITTDIQRWAFEVHPEV